MIERLREEVEKLKKRKNVLGIFLAGSFARKETHPLSDVDLYVLVKRGIKQRLLDPWERFRVTYLTEKELKKRFWQRDWIFSRCLVLSSKILYDPKGILGKIKKEARKYPEEIRQFELRANVFHAKYQLSRAKFAFKKKDFPSAVYFLMRCGEEILFFFYVLNKLFLPSERKIYEERKKIKIKPKNFEKRLIEGSCLNLPPKKIERSIKILESLIGDLERFYKKEEKNWKEEYLIKPREMLK
jgi:predicted nucleotidyltransferase